MAKTAAQRQAASRARRAFAGEAGNGERRINTWVNTGAALALARLARHNGVTQRVMLEKLIGAADDQVFAGLVMDSPEWDAYLGQPSAGIVTQ